MKKYTLLNGQMETLGVIIRNYYVLHDKHNNDEEIKYICDFVEDMAKHEKIEELTKEHQKTFYEYLPRIGGKEILEKVAPDVEVIL